MSNIDKVPVDIRPYFIEIAERLWTGHASVMVGAGFSKNAVDISGKRGSLPNWNQLGDIFYEKIHGTIPTVGNCYLNPLKLADEVQAAFGRSVLDQLLKKHIRDKDFEPSDAHTRLLELPWSDVFTTNYDTLLERGCENVFNRRYDIVINQVDIVYSNPPRIIKLHGSFPSERPLIITEEDYRVYPKKFAPFINTVQQSLLENTLCLIGFSGDDPNFLQWIGWINDNIGKDNSPKIYLIGVLNISDAQKKLLTSKNIIPVDLSNCENVNGEHKKGLDIFLDYLHEKRNKREGLQWPSDHAFVEQHYSDKVDIPKLIEDWKKIRLHYPNWIVLPNKQRRSLIQYTEGFWSELSCFEKLSDFSDIDYCHELNWRTEKCLLPLYNPVAHKFREIIDKYDFFKSPIKLNGNSIELPDGYDLIDLRQKWITLSLSLLRFYREEDFRDDWIALDSTLFEHSTYFSPEQNAQLSYERVLSAIFRLSLKEAKEHLSNWPINSNLLYWEAKRASLLAEVGEIEESEQILQQVLIGIRKRLNLAPIESDYSLVSQEAYVMYMLKLVKQSLAFSKNEYRTFDNFMYDERWNELQLYKCDPRGEIDFFDLTLGKPAKVNSNVETESDFRIGYSNVTHSFRTHPDDVYPGYSFLRFIEDVGVPLSLPYANLNSSTLKGAVQRIAPYSTHWGISTICRTRDHRPTIDIFDRAYLSKLDYKQIDNYINHYLSVFDEFYHRVDNLEIPLESAFAQGIAVIISRFCVKCSNETRLKIFIFYKQLLAKNLKLPESNKLLYHLIDSSSPSTLAKALPTMLDTPLLPDDPRTFHTTPDPFDIDFSINNESVPPLKESVFNDLINVFRNDAVLKSTARKRLTFLHRKNLLTKSQSTRLFRTIWGVDKDENGFPLHSNYYYFAYLKLPYPTEIHVVDLYKKYIGLRNFEIESLKQEQGVELTGGQVRYASELLGGSYSVDNPDGVKWSSTELDDILTKCVQWWEADKRYLLDEKYNEERLGGSIHDEFIARFLKLDNIIARVLGSHKKSVLPPPLQSRLKTLVLEMENANVPILKAKGMFSEIFYSSVDQYMSELQIAITSRNEKIAKEALGSIAYIYANKELLPPNLSDKLTSLLVQPLNWRLSSLIGDVYDTIHNMLQYKKLEFEIIEKDVLPSLDFTRSSTFEKSLKPAEYLEVKQQTMALAGMLFKYYSLKSMVIPKEVIAWQLIANDVNEFGDIRNKWFQEFKE